MRHPYGLIVPREWAEWEELLLDLAKKSVGGLYGHFHGLDFVAAANANALPLHCVARDETPSTVNVHFRPAIRATEAVHLLGIVELR